MGGFVAVGVLGFAADAAGGFPCVGVHGGAAAFEGAVFFEEYFDAEACHHEGEGREGCDKGDEEGFHGWFIMEKDRGVTVFLLAPLSRIRTCDHLISSSKAFR